MQDRIFKAEILRNLKIFPSVVLVGPRQSGKTTLAKAFKGIYFDLEKEEDQIRLTASFLDIVKSKNLIVLDEAQNFPAVFKILRSAIDEDRKKMGRFLLLGSIAPSLMKQVSESLAGRMAVCEMTPFLSVELSKKYQDKIWQVGGYPDGGIFNGKVFPIWQENYLQLLAERDLPSWGLPAKPVMIKKLFKMLAALHGQIWNASEIGGNLGISYHTVNSYLDYLIGCFLIRVLPPYHANIKKRIIKSPRVYWRDAGLLHSLLGLKMPAKFGVTSEIYSMPWVGRSWEGWIIEQVISTLKTKGVHFDAYYFRTSDGKEIDLILDMGKAIWAIEIKLTSIPSSEMIANLLETGALIHATHHLLISKTKTLINGKNYWSTDLDGAIKILA